MTEKTPLTFNEVDVLVKKYGITLIKDLAAAADEDVIAVSNLTHLFENLEMFVEEGFSDTEALENFLRVIVQSFESTTTIERIDQIELSEDNEFWVYTLGTVRLILSNDSTNLRIAKKVSFDGEE